MKKFYLTIAMLCTMVIGMQAQNANRIVVSDNQTVETLDNGVTITRTKKDVKRNVSENATTHTLIIEPEGRWFQITVSNGVDYFNQVWDDSERFEDEVPEGNYSIAIDGKYNSTSALLSYKDVEVYDNVTLTPSMSEATNFIICPNVDENGVPFSQQNILAWNVIMEYSWNNDEYFYNYDFTLQEGATYNDTLMARFNNFGDNVKVYCISTYVTENQNLYAIQQPTITEGISGNVVNVNNPSSFVRHQEYYHCTGDEPKFFDFGLGIFKSNSFNMTMPSKKLDFNPEMPLNIFMNNVTPEDSDTRLAVFPEVFESYSEEWSWPEYYGALVPFNMWLDENGNIRRESFDMFMYDLNSLPIVSAPNYIPNTPATYSNQNGDVMEFGFRTPLTYYQPHEWGLMDSGLVTFIGDGSVQRPCDQYSQISVYYDGELNFEDNLLLFNVIPAEEQPNVVEFNVVNDRIVVDGVVKKNETSINFDLTKDDKDAPTMTILKVMQGNTETVELNNLSDARIEMAAGDFTSNFETFKMEYVGKPTVEVSYRQGGEEYSPIEIVEDEAIFHENYGAYYKIYLSQLINKIDVGWVDVKFVITDAAGNYQTQELSNLMYVSDISSVNEITANSLSHSVYPNPFTNNVTINAAEPVNGVATFTVYNTIGEMVYSSTMNCNETTEFRWDAADNANGVYLYQISTEKGMIQGRVVKE